MHAGALIEQTVQGLGYELVDYEASPRARLLRVFIDKPEGVNVEDCVAVSNQLTRVFEVENVDYDRLEVSSPGLDRALKKEADFVRFAGKDIQLRTRMPINNQRNYAGVLQGMRDGQVILQNDDQGEMCIPFDEVERARLVPKF